MDKFWYFDNSATTFPKPKIVYEKMDEVNRNLGFNSGRGGYKLAQKAADLIEETRLLMKDFVNGRNKDNIIFTPSATIALNMVLLGIDWENGDNIYYSPFEHNSVLRPLWYLKKKYNLNLIELKVNKEFMYDFEKIEKDFSYNRPKLVVVNHVSNVFGLISPIEKICKLVQKYNGKTLIDGAQSLGALEIDLDKIGCDFFVFAGHKNLYGPLGVGGIIFKNEVEKLKPLILGGTGNNSTELSMPLEYPGRLEPGSPNIIAIAGLNASLKWLIKEQNQVIRKKRELLIRLLEILEGFPEIKVFKPKSVDEMLPVVACLHENYTPQEFAMILDQQFDIAVRAGVHCAPKTHIFLGTYPLGTVRFSLSYFNEIKDLEYLEECLFELI